jgi:hypothetical protein
VDSRWLLSVQSCVRAIPARNTKDIAIAQSSARALMSFEILNFAFMLLRLLECCERTQIAALTRFRILLSRVQTKLTGFESANHEVRRCLLTPNRSPSDRFVDNGAVCRSRIFVEVPWIRKRLTDAIRIHLSPRFPFNRRTSNSRASRGSAVFAYGHFAHRAPHTTRSAS